MLDEVRLYGQVVVILEVLATVTEVSLPDSALPADGEL